MLEQTTALENNSSMIISRSRTDWLYTAAIILSAIAIVSSAFHFWPFEQSNIWQALCPSNLALWVWSILLTGYCFLKRFKFVGIFSLPHLSVFAYLGVNILSVAFAPDLSRAVNFAIKLGLLLLGGFTLFSFAIRNIRSLNTIYASITLAAVISVSYCLVNRFALCSDKFGFFNSPYKYGTFIGTLAPLSSAYLFTGGKKWKILLGGAVVIGAFISSGSLGALASLVVGMSTLILILPEWSLKFLVSATMLCGIGILLLLNTSPAVSPLRNDIKPLEKDGLNLKQRYIEWQAEINILEARSITGTSAGCINQYRSNFYYRLPKLNTLKPFDQNGWLATSAETGLLGLVSLCWILTHYGKLAFCRLSNTMQKPNNTIYRFAAINLAGFTAMSAANIFSSVHYNGILIVFVLVLALISRTTWIFGEQQNADNQNY
jgi:hypothetical protein